MITLSVQGKHRRTACWVASLWLFALCLLWGGGASDAARRKRASYAWEDMSDGLFSLLISTVGVDPTKPTRVYAASDGLLYRSDNNGLNWKPLVRFQGTNRTASAQQINRAQRLQQIKERLLEEKIEDLTAQFGEQYARERESELEREAEEEAEDQLAQSFRRSANQTSGRLRRRVYRVIVAPTKPSRVLVATDGGAFMSNNFGRTFKTIFRGRRPGEGNVLTAVFDPRDADKIWLGTQSGLWVSTNGGKLWKLIYGKLRRQAIREVRLHPYDKKTLFVATNRALFVSTDGGKRFLEPLTLPAGRRRIQSLAVLPMRPVKVIVGTGGGLYVSMRRGSQLRFKPLRASGIGDRDIRYLTVSAAAPKNVYLINSRGVFLSTNEGRRFRQLREGMLSNTTRFLSVSPKDASVIWSATEYGLMRWSKVVLGNITKARLRKFQRRLKREPSIWRTVRSSLRFMKIGMGLGRMQTRFRARAFMPQIRVRALITLDFDQEFIPLRGPIPIRTLEGRQIFIEVLAQWNLGRWVYDTREISLIRELRNLRRTRDRTITRVIRLYYARRRLQYRLLRYRTKSLYRYLRLRLKLEELTSQIDGLTNGVFGRGVRRVNRSLKR